MASNNNRTAQLAVGGGVVGLLVLGTTLWAQSNLGARLLPHAYCITGSPGLLWTHVISDALIALAYVLIPLALLRFVRLRRDIPFGWMGLLFGAFIVACGATHAMGVWTVWDPVYWYSGAVKIFTATVSLATAWALFASMPRMLALPTAAQLQAANGELHRQIEYRLEAEALLQLAKRELEERLRATQALLRSNQDLKQFAFVAAHDLRSPLRSLGGYLGLLGARHRAALGDKGEQLLQRAQASVEQMDRMTEGLLSYARLDAQPEPPAEVDCAAAAQEAWGMLQAQVAESGAGLQLEALPTVRGHRAQLVQMFQNLASNAIKYAAAGQAPLVRMGARRGEGEWVFWVADNGIGIAPEHRERIFKMFERLHTQQEYPGTGIGLALCQRIAERHGGRIWVEPGVGGGSVFHFSVADAPGTPA